MREVPVQGKQNLTGNDPLQESLIVTVPSRPELLCGAT